MRWGGDWRGTQRRGRGPRGSGGDDSPNQFSGPKRLGAKGRHTFPLASWEKHPNTPFRPRGPSQGPAQAGVLPPRSRRRSLGGRSPATPECARVGTRGPATPPLAPLIAPEFRPPPRPERTLVLGSRTSAPPDSASHAGDGARVGRGTVLQAPRPPGRRAPLERAGREGRPAPRQTSGKPARPRRTRGPSSATPRVTTRHLPLSSAGSILPQAQETSLGPTAEETSSLRADPGLPFDPRPTLWSRDSRHPRERTREEFEGAGEAGGGAPRVRVRTERV